jgi:penicillin-binding protein 1A
MENIYNQTWHEVMWKNIMDRVNTTLGLQVKNFTMPASVEQKTVCSVTGLLAVSSCPSYTEYFAKGTGPTQSCSGHYEEEEDDEDDDDKNKEDSDSQNSQDSEDNEDSGNSDQSGDNNNNSGNNGNNNGNSNGDSGTVTPPEE